MLLADDHAVMRAGFRMILETEDDIVVVGEAATGVEAVAAASALRPDVICMDVQMPDMDGLEATRRIVADRRPDAAVVIVTTFDRDDYLFQALAAGASGFLLKNAGPEELIAAVRVAAAGDALLAPEVTRRVIERFAADRADRGPAPVRDATRPDSERTNAELTEREAEVLQPPRPGDEQRRDRAAPVHRRGDRQDPRVERAAEARRARPGRRRRLRAPARPGLTAAHVPDSTASGLRRTLRRQDAVRRAAAVSPGRGMPAEPAPRGMPTGGILARKHRRRRQRCSSSDAITKSYGGRRVLDDVSFDVAPGRLTGFVGGNGAGKTTTMRIVLGVLADDGGTVTLDGAELTAAERRRFGYMPEERGLYPKMKVLEQIVYLARLHGFSTADATTRATRAARAARTRRAPRTTTSRRCRWATSSARRSLPRSCTTRRC